MTKKELIDAVASKAELTKADAGKALDAVFAAITAELVKGDSVAVAGFGTFKVTETAAREGINPLTKQPMKIAASKKASFKAASALKDALNK